MTYEQITMVVYQVNKAYQETLGNTVVEWADATDDVKGAILGAIVYLQENPFHTLQEAHEEYVKRMLAAGWRHGFEFSHEDKTHPILVPYAKLPAKHKAEDHLFTTTVRALFELGVNSERTD